MEAPDDSGGPPKPAAEASDFSQCRFECVAVWEVLWVMPAPDGMALATDEDHAERVKEAEAIRQVVAFGAGRATKTTLVVIPRHNLCAELIPRFGLKDIHVVHTVYIPTSSLYKHRLNLVTFHDLHNGSRPL